MKKRPNITPEQSEKVIELREAGCSTGFIAHRLGLSPGTVSWHCLTKGVDPPDLAARPIDPTIRGPLVAIRNGKPVRRYTPDEDSELLRLEAEGLGMSEIGRRVRRRPNSVKGRLLTLARHDARLEAAAGKTVAPLAATRNDRPQQARKL